MLRWLISAAILAAAAHASRPTRDRVAIPAGPFTQGSTRGDEDERPVRKMTVMPADLSTPNGPQQLFDAVQATGKRIDVVVNNAGFGHFGPFLDQTLEQIEEMLAVDIRALTILTRLFATTMKQQGGGRFLQVSSFAGLQPIPRYSVYSAAKSYVVILTQALRHELKPAGVHISVVVPGFMPTEFHDVAHHEKTRLMRLLSMPPSYVARKAVAGMFRGKMVITPGLFYQLNGLALGFVPRAMASALSSWVLKDKATKNEAGKLKSPRNVA